MIRRLLGVIDSMNLNDYSELLFNLYEDKDAYSIEAVFDDDELIIGREDHHYAVYKDNPENCHDIRYVSCVKITGQKNLSRS